MNSELQKIDRYLIGLGFSHDTYQNMSKNSKGKPLVLDLSSEAYNFDVIIKQLFGQPPCSLDSMLLKENLYFFEFKGGYPDKSDPQKDESIKQSIKNKLADSLIVLRELLMKQVNASESFEVNAILVLCSRFYPITASLSVLSSLSGLGSCPLNSPFYRYRQTSKGGDKCFYDNIMIWNDYNFSVNLRLLS